MTLDELNAFCRDLPATRHVVQWGGADVWKVGDGEQAKVFVIARMQDGTLTASFKVTPLSFDVLKDQPGLRPAPYLASRGMKWIQLFEPLGINEGGLDEGGLKDYLRVSHRLVASGLSKKRQRALGLLDEGETS